jgi:hypothetical protein
MTTLKISIKGTEIHRLLSDRVNWDKFVIYHPESNAFAVMRNDIIKIGEPNSPNLTRFDKTNLNSAFNYIIYEMNYPEYAVVAFEARVVNGVLEIMTRNPLRLPLR